MLCVSYLAFLMNYLFSLIIFVFYFDVIGYNNKQLEPLILTADFNFEVINCINKYVYFSSIFLFVNGIVF